MRGVWIDGAFRRLGTPFLVAEARYLLRLHGLAEAPIVEGPPHLAQAATGQVLKACPLSIEFHRWRVVYAAHRAVQLAHKHGIVTAAQLRADLADDELASGLPMEPWEMNALHAGALTHKPGTADDYVLLAHVTPEKFPHPGPPPDYDPEDL